jgi:hypothetical protein
MCGAPVQPSVAPVAQAAVPAPAARRASPVAEDVPSISGPSFLGLNQPPVRRSNLDDGSPLGKSSRSLDYLLEDDGEESKGGAGKIFLILVALALALGFGYLRWRHMDLTSLMSGITTSGAKKPPAAVGDEAQSGTGNAAGPADSSANPGAGSSASQAPPQNQPAAQAAPEASPTGTTAENPSAGKTSENAAPKNEAAASSPDKSAGTEASGGTAPPPAKEESHAPDSESGADNAGDSNRAANSSKDPNVEEKPAEARPAPKPRAITAKPRSSPKPAAAQPFDQVTEAEKYVYGRGVRQDCDRGLRMLQPAAESSNPKAMISLGALYSTGVCAPRDLPTAYRWFALALRKDPENQQLQDNLQRLWVQMTQPERQLAVKLSQ